MKYEHVRLALGVVRLGAAGAVDDGAGVPQAALLLRLHGEVLAQAAGVVGEGALEAQLDEEELWACVRVWGSVWMLVCGCADAGA